ncbi:SSM1 [Coprinopsis cinerea okayama7|uniref:SSM1 n=1 Tax=Coprinopsis cinerea (strain Okayama-7 / 130 / ATCC MYA-4618 / FGSC 9003) TaxID=240176 RepID=A8NXR5_COPC7|nr:SSM1 [Coprinopsis cinerea okayama7\|eukprot:XP_001837245.2 SSM1 [Coprinopsis cinerea okayama7\
MSNSTGNKHDERPVVWFDIDNTLYSASAKISQAMGVRIHDYFVNLGLGHEEASELHHRYYTQYGLALRGLTRHHNVDPLDFDKKCDGSLPLEEMIKYDPKLRKLFEDIDRSKVRVWALTNAFKPHALRVLRILKLDDLAMSKAGITDPSKCYFVDDNRANVEAAAKEGWGHCVHFCEKGLHTVEGGKVSQIGNEPLSDASPTVIDISHLEELRKIWPEIFIQGEPEPNGV